MLKKIELKGFFSGIDIIDSSFSGKAGTKLELRRQSTIGKLKVLK